MEYTALERWLQAWGALTMLISSGFQDLNVPDQEAAIQSKCPESNRKSMERKCTKLGVGSIK